MQIQIRPPLSGIQGQLRVRLADGSFVEGAEIAEIIIEPVFYKERQIVPFGFIEVRKAPHGNGSVIGRYQGMVAGATGALTLQNCGKAVAPEVEKPVRPESVKEPRK